MNGPDRPELKRLDAALDRWGADIAAWPAEERGFANALLATDSEARRRLEAARHVDAALVQLMASDVALAPRAMKMARSSPTRIARWGMVGIAASLLIGFAAGSLLPAQDDLDAGRVFIAVQDVEDDGGFL